METHTAIQKAIDVLFHLHAEPEARGVSDVGRALGLPKSSAHRLLAALSRRGLVEQDSHGRYRTGPSLIALGLRALEREPLVALARPSLEHAARTLGQTFFLVAARGGHLVVLDRVEGSGVLRASPPIGSTLPVHATAVGKLYLAFAPAEVETPPPRLPRYTDRTPRTRAELARQVKSAARHGYAANDEEWIAGLSVAAAPILSRGALVAAVAVGLPSSQAKDVGMQRVAREVLAAAHRVSETLAGGSNEDMDRR